jgi:hypothetical protein
MKKNIFRLTIAFCFGLMFLVPGIQASDAPDLSLEMITVTPSPLTKGDTATLTVVVKNIGNVKSKAVPLFLHGDENALQAFGVPIYTMAEHGVSMPELGAGQPFTYSTTKMINLSPGTYTIRAVIWPGNKPMAAQPMSNSESNLSNNEKEIQFTVKQAVLKPSNLGPKHKIPTGTVPGGPKTY